MVAPRRRFVKLLDMPCGFCYNPRVAGGIRVAMLQPTTAIEVLPDRPLIIEVNDMGSVIKKRRKKMNKQKHRKMLKKTRWQRLHAS